MSGRLPGKGWGWYRYFVNFIGLAPQKITNIGDHVGGDLISVYRFTNLRQAGFAHHIYEWNPCKDFTDTRGGTTENECKNVAVSFLSRR